MITKYRKDIDGLRAIAVMMVVLYHFGFTGITGGFVGVDVFFVISGFLITQILAKQISAKTFSFKEFYVRRIKRLMPAMLVMVGVSLAAFSFILLPNDYVMFSRSIIWVSAYLANIFYWKEYGGYFAGDAQEAPILHTWSLAVEEQFYLVWPIALIASYKFIGAKKTVWLSVIGTIFFVAFSEIATKMTVGAAYYLLPTRAYELMIGATLALAWYKLPNTNKVVTDLLSIVGLCAILYSAFTLTSHDTFPGLNALLPTIGAALLLYTNRDGFISVDGNDGNQGIVNKLISNKLFVFIGLISYSLYLWHWPMIVYINYTAVEMTLISKLGLVVSAIGVAYLSYRYVETPFRLTKKPSGEIVTKAYIIPSVLLIIISMVIISNNGFKSRFDDNINMMDTALNTHSNVLRSECHSSLSDAKIKPNKDCLIGDKSSPIKGLLLGDSHANHNTGFLDVIAKKEGVNIQDYTLDRCPPIIDLYWGKSEYKAKECKARNDIGMEHAISNDFDFIVLSASWPNERSSMIFNENKGGFLAGKDIEYELTTKVEETINFYHKNKMKVIVITDAPFINNNKPNCPLKKELFNDSLDCSTSDSRNVFLDKVFKSLELKYDNLLVVEPRDLVCEKGICQLSLNGVPLYRDADHLNDLGSRELGKEFNLNYGKPIFK
jgi:peptidoglycan/LPS O-acetylase OafA/YrhL